MSLRYPLPAPFSGVTVEIHPRDSRVTFIYTGLPDDLLACGAAESQGMLEPSSKRGPSSVRCDSFGDYYRRQKTTKGRLQLRREIKSTERARSMPGAAYGGDLLTPILQELHANPAQLVEVDDGTSGETVAGTKAALIGAGLVTEEIFGALGDENFTSLHNADGSWRLNLSRWRDGFYELSRPKAKRTQPADIRAAISADRCRAVGRYQREVSWTAVGNVLLVDWTRIKAATLLASIKA